MPWSQTSPMDQRTQFIADYPREVLGITELCDLSSARDVRDAGRQREWLPGVEAHAAGGR